MPSVLNAKKYYGKLCQGWLCNYIDSKDDSWLSTSA
jgi:hypothetical protein